MRRRDEWRRRRLWLALALVGIGSLACGRGASADRLPARVGAAALHGDGVTGRGVTIAVVDRLTAPAPEILFAAGGHPRLLAFHDAVGDDDRQAASDAVPRGAADGHLEAMLSSLRDAEGRYRGVAPGADLVLIRAIGGDGAGRAADVERAIDWVVANRDRYGIRVLHLPLTGRARVRSEDGPLSRAVLEAWRAGIVVVVAAGNGGPAPATIAAPGDVPEVITVGALETLAGGERVPGYSASGPTPGGVVKPEMVAPAGPAEAAPTAAAVRWDGGDTIVRPAAGTAYSSAVVAGVAALLLEASPWLTPDEVKRRLLAGARPVLEPGGGVLSIFRQGAGVVDALGAIGGPEVSGGGRSDGARGFIWSDSEARGIIWSDGALEGITWSEDALQGITWSEYTSRGLTWSE